MTKESFFTTRSITRRGFLRAAALGSAAFATGWTPRPVFAAPASLHGRLNVLEPDPLNAEPQLDTLLRSWVTPTEHVYIRNHGNIPVLDAGTTRLSVQGLVNKPFTLSLEELKRDFPAVTVIAALQCAGNRRTEMAAHKPIKGTPWSSGAIANVEWTGVRLRDILAKAGVNDAAKHTVFEGGDTCKLKDHDTRFGGSAPIEKALRDECIVAYAMNGEPLTPEHGFPFRAVIPGYIGARSVKWLQTIDVSAEESPNHFQQEAYKMFGPEIDDSNVDWTGAPSMGELIVNSAMSLSRDGDKLIVTGWACPSGANGARIQTVEISTDGGSTWQAASLSGDESPFSWRLWRAEIAADRNVREILCCASDSTGAMQPKQAPWNFKGYFENSWQRVHVPSA